jgi:hypothetical protein
MSELRTYHGASTIMRKTLDWNRSRISMLEVPTVNIIGILQQLVFEQIYKDFSCWTSETAKFKYH